MVAQILFFSDCFPLLFSFFCRAKTSDIAVNGCKKSEVLHTLLGVDTELFPFTVCPCHSQCSCPEQFTVNSFGGDFLAGITVASMLVPQSVSYASSLAKLSPVTGLVRPISCRQLALYLLNWIQLDSVFRINSWHFLCFPR